MADSEAVKRLHRAITGGDTVGQYPDPLAGRLAEAVKASYDVLTEQGVPHPPPVAGTVSGPYTAPTDALGVVREQVGARYRADAASRWRTVQEAAEQLARNVAALRAAAPVPTPKPTPTPPPVVGGSWPNALWVGTIPDHVKAVGGKHDDGTTYGSVQRQRAGASIVNSPQAAQVPVVTHPLLGRCLELRLGSGEQRVEVQADGSADSGWGPGTTRWCGFTFCLAADYPLTSTNRFCVVNQVHQSSSSGSPPLEFDVHSGGLWIRGNSTGYNRKVCDVERERAYRVVFGLLVSGSRGESVIDVHVNGRHLIQSYRPPITMGPPLYWKVATGYADPSIRRPVTTYQRDHRIGATYESVA